MVTEKTTREKIINILDFIYAAPVIITMIVPMIMGVIMTIIIMPFLFIVLKNKKKIFSNAFSNLSDLAEHLFKS